MQRAFDASRDQRSEISGQIEEQIRSASSFDNLRDLRVLRGESSLADNLAIAMFNIHLLGRAQVWSDIRLTSDVRPLTSGAFLAAVVLETNFEPLPFDEAIDFFRNKLNLTPAQYMELEERARAKAFTIAGGATRQVRQSIMDLIDQAQSEGLTLSEFQAQADDVLDSAGMSERTPWYWETVYRTNLGSNYQSGRWKQMTDPDVVRERPYLRYVSARLPTSRPDHVAKHGLVYPVDHSFWQTWYPPNGFNCYCTAMSVSESLLDRRGWRVSTRDVADRPDEGFRVNVGEAEDI